MNHKQLQKKKAHSGVFLNICMEDYTGEVTAIEKKCSC